MVPLLVRKAQRNGSFEQRHLNLKRLQHFFLIIHLCLVAEPDKVLVGELNEW